MVSPALEHPALVKFEFPWITALYEISTVQGGLGLPAKATVVVGK
jgi:hypothetical protein